MLFAPCVILCLHHVTILVGVTDFSTSLGPDPPQPHKSQRKSHFFFTEVTKCVIQCAKVSERLDLIKFVYIQKYWA